MDFATTRFFRIVFAITGALVGGAAGYRYLSTFPMLGPTSSAIIGTIVGIIVGWNAVDLIKGRTTKHHYKG